MSSPDWQAGWSAGYDAGYAAGLKAGQVAVQNAFGKTAGSPLPSPAPQRVVPTPDAPFWLLVTRDSVIAHSDGPFTLISDAVASRDAFVEAKRGDLALIYDGEQLASYRGGPAEFRFGLSQWSRA